MFWVLPGPRMRSQIRHTHTHVNAVICKLSCTQRCGACGRPARCHLAIPVGRAAPGEVRRTKDEVPPGGQSVWFAGVVGAYGDTPLRPGVRTCSVLLGACGCSRWCGSLPHGRASRGSRNSLHGEPDEPVLAHDLGEAAGFEEVFEVGNGLSDGGSLHVRLEIGE